MEHDKFMQYGRGLGLWQNPRESIEPDPIRHFRDDPVYIKPSQGMWVETEDWIPVQGYRGELYHTKRKMDDVDADDLQCGDLSASEIMTMGRFYAFAISSPDMLLPASMHFANMRINSKFVSWYGKYKNIVQELIDRFESNTGSKYESVALNDAMKNHRTLLEFNNDIKKAIESILAENLHMPGNSKEIVTSKINASSILPKFDDPIDRVNGLGLAVHDIYALSASVTSLELKGRRYKGVLSYKVQDHFGLDKLDVDGGKNFELLSLFRSWFLLQRYSGYAYKPFITEMNFNMDIQGSF